MRLRTIYTRFYRSLNFDYLRKSDPNYEPDPWDGTPDGAQYPFVKVRLEPDITTVVGANESGKSQLLEAIKRGLTGDNIERGDFCRYSPYFSVDKTLLLPEFGLLFSELTDDDQAVVREICERPRDSISQTVALFRMNETPKLRLYVQEDDEWTAHLVRKPTLLRKLAIPSYFEVDAQIPLPDAVPLDYLATGKITEALGRDSFRRQWDTLRNNASWFSSASALTSSAEKVVSALSPILEVEDETRKMYELADDLLIKVAKLDRSLFDELRKAVARGKNGYARSIVDSINDELAKSLNFPHWWSQDSNFELFVDLREYDLVFMIRDRTGRSYSFDERSGGLKYFLSYFVQYMSHEPPEDGQPEILLMDEPDAYLSSSGQQDLLRIFAAFATPEGPTTDAIQVVYVTHSPFLIDKNHAERIRVLEKGEHEEGTRVVANASRNHYEPLRSAFGSFVGETTFIGTCNLLLEGPSDQVLIVGVSNWLGKRRVPQTQRLDLNAITLVPASSASQVPYLAFLARGRDVDRPAVIVLLDGDKSGDDARSALARGGPRRKPLVAGELVMQLSDRDLDSINTANPAGRLGIEDLIPLEIAEAALRVYCSEFVADVDLSKFVASATEVFKGNNDTVKGLEAAVKAQTDDDTFHLDKIGFARSVVSVINGGGVSEQELESLEANFRTLLAQLTLRQRSANREQRAEQIRSRINRVRRRFENDHPNRARREEVTLLIEEVDAQLDSSMEAEEVRAITRQWIGKLRLDEDPRADIEDFNGFLGELQGLAYAGPRKVQIP